MENSQIAWGRIMILIGGALFIGLVIVLHWLSPEFLPARHGLSQYALGDYGFLMTIAYLVFALALGGAAYRVIVEFPEPASAKFGTFLLLLAAFSFLFAGLLPADPGDVAESMLGKIHQISLRSGLFMILLGAISVSLKMWALPSVFGKVGLGLALVIVGVSYWANGAPEGLAGWPQRALFGAIILWLFAVAFAPSGDRRQNVGES